MFEAPGVLLSRAFAENERVKLSFIKAKINDVTKKKGIVTICHWGFEVHYPLPLLLCHQSLACYALKRLPSKREGKRALNTQLFEGRRQLFFSRHIITLLHFTVMSAMLQRLVRVNEFITSGRFGRVLGQVCKRNDIFLNDSLLRLVVVSDISISRKCHLSNESC